MEFQVNHAPTFSTLQLSLSQNEYVVAQPNSMLTMTAGIRISARAGRQDHHPSGEDNTAAEPTRKRSHSWFGGLKNMLGGENFFTAEFRAKDDGQTVVLAPESYGDIVVLDLSQESGYYLTRGSYLANVGLTAIQIKYGGLKGLMSKKGLFLMHATGAGHVFCQSYGAVIHRYLDEGETLFVDNRFMIAFSDTITYKLVKATDKISDSLMSGEGLVNRYTGPGHLYYQTRGKPTGGFLSTLIDAAF
ncbi:TIGR00266 family protein [Stieleria sp. JC731]|uniref:TIGR00266 family protein n=1 Tax=Pirellulaceae TaxID=2691357 RepID=UPI001E60A96A|nr:TIGR00266 family protein [Stieleria sp. JC731]MCC9601401.1 TIGR00266 family protein [Stieleria sp. JC731]